MSNVEGPGQLTGPVDTGFDDAIAGNVWVDPNPPAAEVERGVAGHTPMRQSDTTTPAPPQPLVTAAVSDALDAAIETALAAAPKVDNATIQATKALVQLPAIGYPELAKLARDVAMDIKERHVILREHNLTQVQYDFLETHNEFFKNALSAASIEWHAPLSTAERIKVEAAAILEDSLPGLGARMQNKSEGLPGVIEAAKLFAKVAGVGERETSGAGSGERFTINIDLGGDAKVTVSTGTDPAQNSGADRQRAIREDAQAAGGLPPIRQQP